MAWGPEESCFVRFVLGGIAVTALAWCGIYSYLDRSGFFIPPTPTNVPTATRLPTATSLPSMVCQEIRPGGGAQSLAILIQRGLDPRKGIIYISPVKSDGSSQGFEVQQDKVKDLPPGDLCVKK